MDDSNSSERLGILKFHKSHSNSHNSSNYSSKHKKSKKKKSKKSKKKKHRRSDNSDSDSSDKKKDKKLKWVLPNIIVRVISSKVHKGRLYNTKVRITDVVDHKNITVIGNEGIIYEGLREDDLETVMPQINQDVIIVKKGKTRGTKATLIERDKKKNKVKLMLKTTTFDIVEMSQDDC